jgi:ABC-2 type transport system ATP-binding protein
VLGLDPWRHARRLQLRIGVQLQESQLQKRVKVREAVDLWASLYPSPADGAALLDRLGLTAKRDAWFMTLSGGQKQRLFIALALINDPEVVFLDELTTGLDPQARRQIWDLVLGIKQRGKTVLLTTHLMEEAERLCDRVAIIEHGRVIEVDTPAALVRRHCPQRQVILSSHWQGDPALFRNLDSVGAVAVERGTVERDSIDPGDLDTGSGGQSIYTIDGEGDTFVSEIIELLATHSIRVTDFRTVLPTLEDVFLTLTGHSIRD